VISHPPIATNNAKAMVSSQCLCSVVEILTSKAGVTGYTQHSAETVWQEDNETEVV